MEEEFQLWTKVKNFSLFLDAKGIKIVSEVLPLHAISRMRTTCWTRSALDNVFLHKPIIYQQVKEHEKDERRRRAGPKTDIKPQNRQKKMLMN